ASGKTMGAELLAEIVAFRARSSGSSLTTPGICPSCLKIICWHCFACFFATWLGVVSCFLARAAATPTACPQIEPVESTRLDSKARYEELIGRPAIIRFSIFLEYKERSGIPYTIVP